MDDKYGTSPAMLALPLLRAWDALPPEEKCKAASAWVREQIRKKEALELIEKLMGHK